MARSARLCLLVVSFGLLVCFVSGNRAEAGTGDGAIVQRLPTGRPSPVVDGSCGLAEYTAPADLRSLILYRPRIDASAARVKMIADGTDLYVCLSSLYLGDRPYTSVSLGFDVNNDGTRTPGTDDILLILELDSGGMFAQRGNGSDFVTDSSITGWQAASGFTPSYVGSEFRVPLRLIGNGAAHTQTGFFVLHGSVRSRNDDYVWPFAANRNVPLTWGWTYWFPIPTSVQPILVDVARVTQGMDTENLTGQAYDLIAGKDTLARAQLFTTGMTAPVASARCVVRQINRLSSGVPLPVNGPERIFPLEGFPAAAVRKGPARAFDGGTVFNCWVRGTFLREPGDYQFSFEVQLSGGNPQRIEIGTRRFLPTADFRLFLYGYNGWPPPPGNTAVWDAAHISAANEAAHEFQRRFPLRAGVSGLASDVGVAIAGLRYMISPIAGSCDFADNPACMAGNRNEANLALNVYNASARIRDAVTGAQSDRLDWGMVMYAVDTEVAGNSCWSGHRVGGTDSAANLQSGTPTILAHEIAHCLNVQLVISLSRGELFEL